MGVNETARYRFSRPNAFKLNRQPIPLYPWIQLYAIERKVKNNPHQCHARQVATRRMRSPIISAVPGADLVQTQRHFLLPTPAVPTVFAYRSPRTFIHDDARTITPATLL